MVHRRSLTVERDVDSRALVQLPKWSFVEGAKSYFFDCLMRREVKEMNVSRFAVISSLALVIVGAPAWGMDEAKPGKAKSEKVEKAAKAEKASKGAEKAEGKASDKAKEKAAAPAKAKSPALKGYYGMMASELNLDEAQQAKLAAVAEEKANAEKSWKEQNKSKQDELTAAAAKAREAEDKEGAAKAKAELAELNKGAAGIAAGYNDKINDILTPEQRKGWVSMKLHQSAMQKYAKAQLTDDQKAQAKELAKGLGSAGVGKSDAELGELKTQLYKQIDEKVLTDEQRSTVSPAKPAKKEPAKEKKDKKD